MRRTTSRSGAIAAACLSATVLSSAALAMQPTLTAAPPNPPRYVESSTGLESPRWDGGRTILKLADLNLDGHPDIVTVGDHGSPFINTDMHGITVWFGNGEGQWAPFQNGNFGYGGVAVGDVNNDGLPDVGWGVHHNYAQPPFGDRVMGVALGDGTGRNWTPWDLGLGVNGQSWGMFGTEFADFNADGLLDVASVSFGCCDGFHAHLNNGDGTWTRTFGWLGGNSSMDMAAGDINNDGRPDFAIGHQYGTIWLGDGAGGFTSGDANLPPGGLTGRKGIHLGDVNGDGFDDLSLVNAQGGIEVYLHAPGSGQWVWWSNGLPQTGGFQVTRLADMNADGLTDVVAFGSGRLAVWLQNGDAGWVGTTTFSVPNPGTYAGFVVGDATHNGRPDIAIVSDQGSIFNSRNKLQFFRETTEAATTSIRITGPPRYRTIRDGSIFFVDWLSAVPRGLESSVRIELSEDGPAGPWLLLGDALPNNGRAQFIANVQNHTGNAWIRATLRSAQGERLHMTGPISFIP